MIKAVVPVRGGTRTNDSLNLEIAAPAHWQVKPGDSVAVNGVCLTVTHADAGVIAFQLVKETLDKTTFGASLPERVNVEQALRVGDSLDGHVVTGHVDTVGVIKKMTDEGDSVRWAIEFPEQFARLVAEKGSIAVDGVSLTVAAFCGKNCLEVALIPYTQTKTTLSDRRLGDAVNLEFDIIAKHLDRLSQF